MRHLQGYYRPWKTWKCPGIGFFPGKTLEKYQNTLEFWFMITTWSKKPTLRVVIVKNFPRAFGARLFSYNSL